MLISETSPYVQLLPSLLFGILSVIFIYLCEKQLYGKNVLGILPLMYVTTFSLARLIVSALSEPIYIFLIILTIYLLLKIRYESQLSKKIYLLLIPLILMQIVRYEGWFISFAIWSFIIFAIIKNRSIKKLDIKLLLLGYLTLLFFPTLWSFLNLKVNGNFFHYLNVVKSKSFNPDDSFITHITYLIKWLFKIKPVLIILSILGVLFILKKNHDWLKIKLIAIVILFCYFLVFTGNIIGTNYPQRLALPPYIILLFFGSVPLYKIIKYNEKLKPVALMLLLLFVIINGYEVLFFDQGYLDKNLRTEVNALKPHLLRGNTVIIFDYESPQGEADLQAFRCLLPYKRIICAEWLKPYAPLSLENIKRIKLLYCLFRDEESLDAILERQKIKYTIKPIGKSWFLLTLL